MPDSSKTFDTPTKKILPFILATAIFMQMLDSTILNTSLPSIAKDLHESPLNMQNAIISYVLTLALFMPVSGEIIELNAGLDNSPESVNSDPYGAGWMIKVKIANASEIDSLLSDEAYKQLIGA